MSKNKLHEGNDKYIIKADNNKNRSVTTDNIEKRIIKDKINKLRTSSITFNGLHNIKSDVSSKAEINKDILNMLPDLNLSMEIITSSILNPNTMDDTTLTYKFKNINLPINIVTTITTKLKEYIENNYNIEDKLYDIVMDTLFVNGSYAELIIPSDNLIDMYKLLTTTTNKNDLIAGIEHLDYNGSKIIGEIKEHNGLLNISDDISLLTLPHALEEGNEARFDDIYSSNLTLGFEDREKEANILTLFDSGNNRDKPYITKLDISNVIPIISKDKSKHLGYFVITDEQGATVVDNSDLADAQNFIKNLKENKSNSLIESAKTIIKKKHKKIPKLNNIDFIREELVISKLKNSLVNNKLSELGSVKLEGREDLIDIMVTRVLKKKKTNVIFVPENLLAFYAYKYRENGTGETLTENISVLASMRAMTLFVSLMANIKSSVPSTTVNCDIDPDNPDYERTMEKVINEVLNNRQMGLPIGLLKVDDVVDWLHKVGFSFNFNHPGLPDTKITIEENKLDINPVDSDLGENLDKQMLRSFGLNPEIIDNAHSPEFATTIIQNNILLSRRIKTYQKRFNTCITKHIQKILKVDGIIQDELKELVRLQLKDIRKYLKRLHVSKDTISEIDNISDDELIHFVIISIINKLEVTLPKVETSKEDNITKSFNEYKDTLDEFVDLILNEDIIPSDIIGEFADKIDVIKNIIKSILIKKWVNENGYMEDLMSIFTLGKDGTPLLSILDEYDLHIDSLEKAILPFLKKMKKQQLKIDKKISKIEDIEDDEENDEENNNDDNLDNDNNNDNEDNIDDNDNEDNEDNNDEDNVDEDLNI